LSLSCINEMSNQSRTNRLRRQNRPRQAYIAHETMGRRDGGAHGAVDGAGSPGGKPGRKSHRRQKEPVVRSVGRLATTTATTSQARLIPSPKSPKRYQALSYCQKVSGFQREKPFATPCCKRL
jgi:hypothetical protein